MTVELGGIPGGSVPGSSAPSEVNETQEAAPTISLQGPGGASLADKSPTESPYREFTNPQVAATRMAEDQHAAEVKALGGYGTAAGILHSMQRSDGPVQAYSFGPNNELRVAARGSDHEADLRARTATAHKVDKAVGKVGHYLLEGPPPRPRGRS